PHVSATLPELLRSFPRTVALPPLRHHVEDLPELVRFFMGKLSQHSRLTCSPEAMQLLARSTWPGNIEQLWQVMRSIVARKRVGSIEPGDLPPECWTVSRRRLSPLEALERDAIVQSLLDSGGNKAKAAEALGMSRATIYRKIHGYGIVIPARGWVHTLSNVVTTCGNASGGRWGHKAGWCGRSGRAWCPRSPTGSVPVRRPRPTWRRPWSPGPWWCWRRPGWPGSAPAGGWSPAA